MSYQYMVIMTGSMSKGCRNSLCKVMIQCGLQTKTSTPAVHFTLQDTHILSANENYKNYFLKN